MKKRVVVAMSGGVDSSTSAWLLKEKGYEVIGATICIGVMDREPGGPIRCCSITDMEDARRIAIQLGIPFYVFHLRDEFEREVIQYFCEEYLKGKTPNPCIICNEKIKFGSFLKKAIEMDADYISTGHYVRLELDEKRNEFLLKKAIDQRKDQSYVLFSLKQDQLSSSIFPLGEFGKNDVRRKAFEIGLQVYNKPESQEICFIRDHSYHSFLSERLKESIEPGPILDRKGNVLGRHKGIAFYTIGQRRGLGIKEGRPLYVIEIDRRRNVVVVGGEEEAYGNSFIVRGVNWINSPFIRMSPFSAQVKIRYNHKGEEAKLFPKDGGKVEVIFKSPQKAITPGQAAVFYDGDLVLGGGWIEEVIN